MSGRPTPRTTKSGVDEGAERASGDGGKEPRGLGRAGTGERRVFNAASLGATRITKVKKEVFNNFSFSLYLLSHVS